MHQQAQPLIAAANETMNLRAQLHAAELQGKAAGGRIQPIARTSY